MRQKKDIDEKQKALLVKMNEIKAKNDEYSQRRAAIVVSRLMAISCILTFTYL